MSSNIGFGASQLSRKEILQMIIRVSLVSVVTFYSFKWIMNLLDPNSKNKKNAKNRAEQQLKRLSVDRNFKLRPETLNDYEMMIASHIIVPDDISVSWDDIAGLENTIQELRETVVLPIMHKHLFDKSKLWEAPKGVLLHGPPGYGKTMIAKAIAKEAGMRFINLDVAMMMDKWYGETQKLASAVFSLAIKLEPCIIFIDEIDAFLRSRRCHDTETTAMLKTQFMVLWDGLSTRPETAVIVMGATNRPQDLDKAILRRMPAQFHIGHPSEGQRLQILNLILKSEMLTKSVDLPHLAKLAKGFSGSDLREMCRNASVERMREFMRENEGNLTVSSRKDCNNNPAPSLLNPISMDDLMKSYDKLKETKRKFPNIRLE